MVLTKSKLATYFLIMGIIIFVISLLSEWYNEKSTNTGLERQKEYLEKLILENKYSIHSHDSLIKALEAKYGDRRESVEIVNKHIEKEENEKNYINTLPIDSTVRNLSRWLSEKSRD